jgi:Tfp pilus assembly protein PilE
MAQEEAMARRRRGMTLMQVMVAVSLMGILTTISIPQYKRIQCRAKQAEAKSLLRSIYMSEQRYMSDYGKYVDLVTLNNAHDKALKLANGNYYSFTMTNSTTTFTVVAQDTLKRIRRDTTSDIWRITQVANSLAVTTDACR